jgi:hypothetical protein
MAAEQYNAGRLKLTAARRAAARLRRDRRHGAVQSMRAVHAV